MADGLDELTSQLSEGFQVDPTSLGEHPRFSQFKNYTKAAEQQAQRRLDLIARQQEGRFDKLLKLRNLAFDDVTSEEEDGDGEEEEENRRRRRGNRYADKLMLSEWLVDIPDTLSVEWTMMMAPVGKRTLVVASRGVTTAYNKAGRKMSQFQSKLPGGNSKGKSNSWTILDCIYHNQVYHVLDILSWNGHEYAENPFDFRQFMLLSKLQEMPELAESSPGFRNTFVAVPSCGCSQSKMAALMAEPVGFKLDGLLFYHNSVIYEPGQSPFVGWLKPWMLPELLEVNVPEIYLKDSKGQTSAQFIEHYNQKHHHQSKIDKGMDHD